MRLLVDSHSHLADPRIFPRASELILQAKAATPKFNWIFLQAGVDPEDWQRQIELAQSIPEILCCFGIHPISLNASTPLEDLLHKLTDFLTRENSKTGKPWAQALGEVGLDFRKPYLDFKDVQFDAMEAQLEMAEFLQLPVVYHFVRCHPEAWQILNLSKSKRNTQGMIHAFNSDWEIAKKYLDLDLFISLGGAITHPRNKHLLEVMTKIPLDRILFETDAPDQKIFLPTRSRPENISGEVSASAGRLLPVASEGEPKDLLEIVDTFSSIRGVPADQIIEIAESNFFSFISSGRNTQS